MKLVARGLRIVAAAMIVLASLVIPPKGARAAGPVQFGIDEGNASPTMFKQSGATWDRIDFFWDAYQPTGPTDWVTNPRNYDDEIASDLASGIQVVGVVTNPPAWATRNGSVPSGLDLPIDDPKNYWAAFMHKLAATYAGRVTYWIIWNEPDFDPQHYANSSWGGTEDEFYLLTKDADLAAKAANPQAKIVFAGTIYWTDALLNRKLFLDRVLDRATAIDPTAPANGYYFDAVDIHIYSSPYQLLTTPKIYRDVLASWGLSKPIWVSEMNVVPWDDPDSKVPRGGMRATLQEQAAYIIQAFALARVSGIERAAVYKLVDGMIERGEPYGLVRNDGSTRPAYAAYQTAIKYLAGAGTTNYVASGDARIVTITNGKQKVTVAWTTKPTAMDLKVVPSGASAQLVTKLGAATDLALPTDPNQPNYVLNLAPATANTDDGNSSDYIIGGDPVILVENGVGDPVTLSPTKIYYPITGFAISGAFLDYFQHRGGVDTFGYPISRPFPLLGSQVQLFQRRALELRPDGTVGQLNLLDPGMMPYTQINDATFPAVDPNLTKGLPTPGTANYDQKIMDYVRTNAPNQWNGLPLNFGATFFGTVSPQIAFPDGKVNAALLPGIDLELWGVPTSQPAEDPNNHNFVYQRFQRGIMHYDKTTGLTQGLLIGDAFKSIITGQNLPSDLASEAQGSRFYLQYDARQPHWVARPDQLPNTDLSFAFQRQPATP
ncbi:MAG TPA: hypothetical protein VFZ25_20170 [Chloroflexota bacterium]|nr:hypothetical protein [Chloroflexota bacterium]